MTDFVMILKGYNQELRDELNKISNEKFWMVFTRRERATIQITGPGLYDLQNQVDPTNKKVSELSWIRGFYFFKDTNSAIS